MALSRLGNFIELVDIRNKNGFYKEKDVRGISTTKIFIKTKANLNNVNLLGYKIVQKNCFAYVADTSRRGEKIAIALALRLGITQAMSNGELDTILLDEPTIHLDSSRRHELINLLKEISSLPQMIIVTHESQLENAADNLVKVEKNNGISKVSN